MDYDERDEVCEGVDEECICGEHWSDQFAAIDSFMLYMTQFSVWDEPDIGAVSRNLSEFFRCCDPDLPAVVHWARWLRIEHACDQVTGFLPLDRAEALLEALIASQITNQDHAKMMRLAFHEGFGELDPDQLSLFDPSGDTSDAPRGA